MAQPSNAKHQESTEGQPRAIYIVRPTQKKAIKQVFHIVDYSDGLDIRRFTVEENYRLGHGYLTSIDSLPRAGQPEIKCEICTDYLETSLEDGAGNNFQFYGDFTDEEKTEIRDGWNGESDNGSDSCSEGWVFEGNHSFNLDVEEAYILIDGGEFEVDLVEEKTGIVLEKNIPLAD